MSRVRPRPSLHRGWPAHQVCTGGLVIYDRRNPYFGGAGEWAGWAEALAQATDATVAPFVAVSWQELVGLVPRDESLVN